MNRIILLVWLALAVLCTFLTSCSETRTARFKGKEYFYNSVTREMVVSKYTTVFNADPAYSVGDTVELNRSAFVITAKLSR